MPLHAALASITALLAVTPVDEEVARTKVPLAELLTGEGDTITQHDCWPDSRACGTRFDLASVTKPLTALAVLASGVPLDDYARTHLPAFTRKEPITVRQLIEHTSGLKPFVPVDGVERGRPLRVLELIVMSKLRKGPTYSDLNFIVAGQVVERVTGRALDEVLREKVFGPLQMNDTTWYPGPRHAPNGVTPGLPHDPIAQVCRTSWSAPGHAGAFSTVDDLGKLLRGIVGEAPQLDALRAELANAEGKSTVAGWSAAADGAWSKNGWTGTFLWFQPATKRWAVFLSNRTAQDSGWIDFQAVVTSARR